MEAYTARAAARQPNGAGVLGSVYATLAGAAWLELQGDLQRQLPAMVPGDREHLNEIVEAVERFWIGQGYTERDLTLRRALGWKVAESLDFGDVALLRSLQVVLVKAHCARGDQVISDGNTCGVGCCVSTVMSFKLLKMASAGGGFGRGKKVLAITINGAPLCERDRNSACGCAAPKTPAEVKARRLFVEWQTALVRAFFGPTVSIAVMHAHSGHADGGTVGSVTLSQTGAAFELALSVPHPASLNRKVAGAMGTGGTAERKRSRAEARAAVTDAVVAIKWWAAALAVTDAVMREPEPPPGLPVVPFAGLLDAIAAAVEPVAVTLDELRALWINPAEASGASDRRTRPCARRSGRKHERRAVQVSGASTAKKCTRRVAAARVSADNRPEVPFATHALARAHTARAERRARCCAPRRAPRRVRHAGPRGHTGR